MITSEYYFSYDESGMVVEQARFRFDYPEGPESGDAPDGTDFYILQSDGARHFIGSVPSNTNECFFPYEVALPGMIVELEANLTAVDGSSKRVPIGNAMWPLRLDLQYVLYSVKDALKKLKLKAI